MRGTSCGISEMRKDRYDRAWRHRRNRHGRRGDDAFPIIAVFVPLHSCRVSPASGFQPFALTIACSVLVSLFVSFSLDRCSRRTGLTRIRKSMKAWITKKLAKFNLWFNGLANGYRRVVRWALDHPKSMMFLAVASFRPALSMPALGLVGGEFFPLEDNAEVSLTVDAPPGANIDFSRQKTGETLRLVEKYRK
ncbi:MAG: efflux RND transporter permease subunit [Gemmatimonadaceae bacterium]|nr:efflux RND transporter permease subunit [Gemmatimonadaceae bacterium]